MQTKPFDSQTENHSLRYSNIELLRIVAMVLIVAHHFAKHSGFDFPLDKITINRLWIQFIEVGGKLGVDLFVLISGYFLISQKTTKTSRLLKLWGQIFFYSVLIFLIFTVSGIKPLGLKELIKHIAPITCSQWWFASTYFVLYLLVPYINRLLHTFDKDQYILFLAVLVLLWSVIPSFTGQAFQSNALLWFVVLYSIAGYIRLYGIKTALSSRRLLGYAFACLLLTFLSAIVFDIMGIKIPFFGKHATFFYGMQKLPILIISLLMFIGFTKLSIGYHKSINLIASATFGVYLIHDSSYVRSFLWKTLFNSVAYSDSNLLILYSMIVIIIVFVGCSVIELMRIHLIENHAVSYFDRISMFIDNKIKMTLSNKLINLFK